MKFMKPTPDVPGDNDDPIQIRLNDGTEYEIRPHIMARAGEFIGGTSSLSLWRFGFRPDSESANAFGVSIDDGHGFLWVISDTLTGEILVNCRGSWVDLPPDYKRIANA